MAKSLVACLAAALVCVPAASRDQMVAPPEHARTGVFNRALGVECSHCHVRDVWTDRSKAAFAVASNMIRMVGVLNQKLAATDRVSCVTCHGGEVRPARQPREPVAEQLAKWPADLVGAPEAQKITMAVYNVALGVDCGHCHVIGDWKSAAKPALRKVSLMNSLFEEFPKYMPPTARTQCFMCHKGSVRPRREGR